MDTHLNSDLPRCTWCNQNPQYRAYHDYEWGVLVQDDSVLFEFILLEGAQAGLNWLTILLRRENYRSAFHQFDFHKIAEYSETKIEELMTNSGIIRNRSKIESTITNARAFIRVREEFGSFYQYTLKFFSEPLPLVNYPKNSSQVPTESNISKTMSADMKKRGFRFFGSITCYAYLQATGAINDHIQSCFLASKTKTLNKLNI